MLVKAAHVLAAPEGRDLHALAAIPYSFATMWLAVRGAGLTRENAVGKKVLVHGAAGGLGTLATQMLSHMGGEGYGDRPASRTARRVLRRVPPRWSSEQTGCSPRWRALSTQPSTSPPGTMISRCSAACATGALGHATTVHPMLANFDRLGWVRGALKTISQKRNHRRALPKGTNNYAWILFKPDKAALADLRQFVEQNRVSLPIGLRKPLAEVGEAFDHVKKGQPGRALLLP